MSTIKFDTCAGYHVDYNGCHIEIFFHAHDSVTEPLRDENGERIPEGWYWWACQEGYLPEGDPIGPFETSTDAWEEGVRDDTPGAPDYDEPARPDDGYDDGQALASAGMGTDEDYGCYGGDEW
jgi:hypothetical protein|tara:strand:+ start:171 stop:539 length:369 start_codon:yes stop_codon:yes gene_type:complete